MGGKQSARFYSGRVEVRHVNGSWGTVCSDRFDNREALVICKMFGHQYGIARSSAYFGRGTGHIFMDDLNCKGNESSILDCPYNGWGRHNCGTLTKEVKFPQNLRSPWRGDHALAAMISN